MNDPTPTTSAPTTTASPGLSADAFSSMFQAVRGLHNTRALAAMLGCVVVGVLVAGLCSWLALRLGFFMAFLGGLGFFVAGATGVNAAGVLLMDQAKGRPARTLGAAVAYGLMCIPKFIALALGLLLVAIGVFIGIALLYFICKIPYLGPLLFVVVFPLSVVVSGVTVCGLFLCLFLALPAIWEGSGIARAIAQALAIVRTRLVEAMLLSAVVGLLSGAVGLIVFSVLLSGLMPTMGLAASVLGGDALASVMSMAQGGGEGGFGAGFGGGFGGRGYGGGAGHAMAAGVGGGLLWALAASLVAMVYLLGLNLVYLRVTEGLDAGATEAALKSGLDDARRRAAEMGQKARDAAERARDAAREAAAPARVAPLAATATAARGDEPTLPPPAPQVAVPSVAAAGPTLAPGPRPMPPEATAPAVAKSSNCPQCLSAVGADDLFCGVCGQRLK